MNKEDLSKNNFLIQTRLKQLGLVIYRWTLLTDVKQIIIEIHKKRIESKIDVLNKQLDVMLKQDKYISPSTPTMLILEEKSSSLTISAPNFKIIKR